MIPRLVLLSFLCLATSGCWRTVYRNVIPSTMPHEPQPPSTYNKKPPSTWQHFFLFGLLPTEAVIEADDVCGGEEHIRTIETQQTILQRLIIVATAGPYYVNIYSPYDANVTCDFSPPP